jgi:hypothetical protein
VRVPTRVPSSRPRRAAGPSRAWEARAESRGCCSRRRTGRLFAREPFVPTATRGTWEQQIAAGRFQLEGRPLGELLGLWVGRESRTGNRCCRTGRCGLARRWSHDGGGGASASSVTLHGSIEVSLARAGPQTRFCWPTLRPRGAVATGDSVVVFASLFVSSIVEARADRALAMVPLVSLVRPSFDRFWRSAEMASRISMVPRRRSLSCCRAWCSRSPASREGPEQSNPGDTGQAARHSDDGRRPGRAVTAPPRAEPVERPGGFRSPSRARVDDPVGDSSSRWAARRCSPTVDEGRTLAGQIRRRSDRRGWQRSSTQFQQVFALGRQPTSSSR